MTTLEAGLGGAGEFTAVEVCVLEEAAQVLHDSRGAHVDRAEGVHPVRIRRVEVVEWLGVSVVERLAKGEQCLADRLLVGLRQS
ncbi:hypothetical protein ACX9NE_09455 [Mycobacterium sp. ML4]